MFGWLLSPLVGRFGRLMVFFFSFCVADWWAHWMYGCLIAGLLIGQFICCLIGWLIDLFVGWFVVRSVC